MYNIMTVVTILYKQWMRGNKVPYGGVSCYNLAIMFGLTLDFDSVIIYALIIVVGLLAAEVFRLNQRLMKTFLGKQGRDLEEAIDQIIDGQKEHGSNIDEIGRAILNIDKRLKRSIQFVRTIRFNPFADQGGNQSFATSFLDEEGDGTIISSLYSRDKVSVYAKPIKNRTSDYELSGEERQALEKSK